jgi:hypothetical protein
MMAKASRSAGPRMAARSGRFLVSHDYARPTERVEFLVDCIGLVTAVRRQPNLKERCCAPAPDDSAHDHRQSVSATRPALTNALTCLPVFGPIFAGKFQFSGMGRWTRKDHEEIEGHGVTDCLHPASG